ncbi:MAG: hypothetical protein P4M09_15420 [Devosia sp.]|nr:hypothetical protein [Devosia sp.]
MAFIEAAEAVLLDLPTIGPHVLATATMHWQAKGLVRIRCSNSIVGFGDDSFAAGDFAFATREALLPFPGRQADGAYIGVDFEIQKVKSDADDGFASRAHAIA